MAIEQPGHPGSKHGQIDTPMCKENVGNKGGGKTHSYAKALEGVTGEKSGGKGNSILGPGAKATGAPLGKTGSNMPGKY